MSYSLNVTVKDGQAVVTATGDVPPGEYTVSGHDGDRAVQISVTRRGPDGRFVASANHRHSRES